MRPTALLGVALLSVPGLAVATCEELKGRIAEGMTSRGFTAFQLDIVAADAPETGTVVGRCEERTKKILYTRTLTQGAPAPASSSGVAAAGPAAVTPATTQPAPAIKPAATTVRTVPAEVPGAVPSTKSAANSSAAPAVPRTGSPEVANVSAARAPALESSATTAPARAAPAAVTNANPALPLAAKPSAAAAGPRLASKPGRTVAPGTSMRDSLGEGGEGPVLVVIPGGEFVMGSSQPSVDRRYSEGPEHRVKVPPFALARTETTFDDYDRFAKATGRRMPDDGGLGRGPRPVTDVSWLDAIAYTQWLTAQTGFTYRLPSEAEWEYAARAGGKPGLAYSTGECISAKQANFNDATVQFKDCPSSGVNLGRSQPVGSYPANAFGVFDMHGNVFEWTADCVHLSYADAPGDGSAWLQDGGGKCSERMVRGGSWQSGQISVRSSLRAAIGYSDASALIGFRVARTL